jgi:hypothetical protein
LLFDREDEADTILGNVSKYQPGHGVTPQKVILVIC